MYSVRPVTLVTFALFTLPVWPQQQQRLFTQQSESIRVRNKLALVIGNAEYKGSDSRIRSTTPARSPPCCGTLGLKSARDST